MTFVVAAVFVALPEMGNVFGHLWLVYGLLWGVSWLLIGFHPRWLWKPEV